MIANKLFSLNNWRLRACTHLLGSTSFSDQFKQPKNWARVQKDLAEPKLQKQDKFLYQSIYVLNLGWNHLIRHCYKGSWSKMC